MKDLRNEPVFLLEMPYALRHLIMRRGIMLRGSRTRMLCCMNKGGQKAWLEAKLIPNAGESAEENWDKAHELASRFKRELRADVYVEPAIRPGRFVENRNIEQGVPLPLVPMPPMPARSYGDFGPALPGIPDLGGFGPHIPDPVEQINKLLAHNGLQDKQRDSVIRSELHHLPGWPKLPSNWQQMFETEAAQLIKHGLKLDANSPSVSQSTLAMLSLQPDISKKLREFLNASFAE